MPIKLSDVDDIVTHIKKIRAIEEVIAKSVYQINTDRSYTQTGELAFHKDSKFEGESDVHKAIRTALREYRKVLVKQLKMMGLELTDENIPIHSGHGGNAG